MHAKCDQTKQVKKRNYIPKSNINGTDYLISLFNCLNEFVSPTNNYRVNNITVDLYIEKHDCIS